MLRWKRTVLDEVRARARAGQVVLTEKARRELDQLALEGIDEDDLLDALRGLEAGDLERRLRSQITGEWLYVFRPKVQERVLYLKVAVRTNCVVISFHDDR